MVPVLRIVLPLLALATMCRAQCFISPLELKYEEKPPEGCQDRNGKMHEFGSTWVDPDCFDCTCFTSGMSCCNKIPTIVSLPPHCKMLVDNEKCTYKIVKKANPNVKCILKGNERIEIMKKK
ncbi:beta-microseminoprotein-like [Arapaima gigas]